MGNRKRLLFLVIIVGVLAMVIGPIRRFIRSNMSAAYRKTERIFKPTGPAQCRDCKVLFDDDVKAHDLAYLREGITEQEDFSDLVELEEQGVLVRISDNDYYTIQELQHSQPLLLRKASDFLSRLGRIYKEKCEQEDLEYVPFEISSVTRSIKSVKQLMRSNVNAIPESHHMKGKTFDISYATFSNYGLQYDKFVAALSELKSLGVCFVKYERRQRCFHISVR